MLGLSDVGAQIVEYRKKLKLSQTVLAHRARISRATLDALENARSGEIGFSRLSKLLAALGLEFKVQPVRSDRPTLDELLEEDLNDQSLDRRR